MLLVEPSLAELPAEERAELLWRFVKVGKPAVGQRLRITSKTGESVHLTVIGMLLTSAIFEKLMRSDERETVILRVEEAVSLARSLGCEITGLGGYTSIATLNCTAVARPDTALTSGSAFTAALGLLGVSACAAERGLPLSSARAGVVGAKGNIGSVCARLLAEDVREIVLVGRDAADPALLSVAEAIFADAWGRITSADESALVGVASAIAGSRTVRALLEAVPRPAADDIGRRIRLGLEEELGRRERRARHG